MSDNTFSLEQRKVIYNAVQYYQKNVPVKSKTYQTCDVILQSLFDECKFQIEPAYQIGENI